MESIFNKHRDSGLKDFITRWSALAVIDAEKAHALAIAALKYYRGSKPERESLRHIQELERRWYASLEAGKPDFSLYGDQYFLSDIWACWILYSRTYLLRVRHALAGQRFPVSAEPFLENVKSIVDLGCGFGYTTAALKELFPAADVHGTNFPGGIQWKFAEQVGKEYGFTLAPDVQSLNRSIDFVFASEYFEHFEDPVSHLEEVLAACQPAHLLIANAFGTVSMGHFIKYKYKGTMHGTDIGSVFDNVLRSAGYERIMILYNDKPAYWRKTAREPEPSFSF